ncbi:hypothetical protein [Kribbella sp. NPDC004875]|uniref:hypothetical protein n=1 Tax=Kribbella sp. NPDC004875 TaxID=3364107 RepID=UPI0036BD80ED
MRAWAVTVSVLVLLVSGCSGTSGGSSPPDATSAPDSTSSADNTSEPAPEPTAAESTQQQQNKPSIEIASLPIGGVPDGGSNCNPISWLAGDIPDGVTITLGTPSFQPEGVFEVDQSGCTGNEQSCEGVEWTAQNLPQCWVGFRQVADEGSVTLVIPADATCQTQQQCDDLKGLGGSQIGLTAQPRESPTPSGESPTPSSESPTPSGG